MGDVARHRCWALVANSLGILPYPSRNVTLDDECSNTLPAFCQSGGRIWVWMLWYVGEACLQGLASWLHEREGA